MVQAAYFICNGDGKELTINGDWRNLCCLEMVAWFFLVLGNFLFKFWIRFRRFKTWSSLIQLFKAGIQVLFMFLNIIFIFQLQLHTLIVISFMQLLVLIVTTLKVAIVYMLTTKINTRICSIFCNMLQWCLKNLDCTEKLHVLKFDKRNLAFGSVNVKCFTPKDLV